MRYMLGHKPYKIYPPHRLCFPALPCEVMFVQKFSFCHTRQSKNNKIKTWSLVQFASFWIGNWCRLKVVFKVSAICTNTFCETATSLTYCCDCDRVVHLSSFSSAFLFINNNSTTSQLRQYKVIAAQIWWFNLIIELATVSIIYVQKIVNIKNTV